MLYPMSEQETAAHKRCGFYKDRATMAKDERRRRGLPAHAAKPEPAVVEMLPPIEYEIQAHDD